MSTHAPLDALDPDAHDWNTRPLRLINGRQLHRMHGEDAILFPLTDPTGIIPDTQAYRVEAGGISYLMTLEAVAAYRAHCALKAKA